VNAGSNISPLARIITAEILSLPGNLYFLKFAVAVLTSERTETRY
jgi:hypothetical protein